MFKHPCAKGLNVECFFAYAPFAKQALAYRMLYTLVPYEVIRFLPGDLNQPLIGPETIVPSGVTFPPGWTVFPDVEFPQGWILTDPPPEGVFPPPVFSPKLPESGGSAPLFVQLFNPGPVHRPSPGPGINEYTVSILATATAWANNADADWSNTRNTESAVTKGCEFGSPATSILVSYISGLYQIRRIYNEFSLATIPAAATIISATLSLKLEYGASIIARAYANFGDFFCISPDYLDTLNLPSDRVILSSGENLFALSPNAIEVIQAKIGSMCCINTRENTYDYDDMPPGDMETFEASFYNCFAETENKPALNITYEA